MYGINSFFCVKGLDNFGFRGEEESRIKYFIFPNFNFNIYEYMNV